MEKENQEVKKYRGKESQKRRLFRSMVGLAATALAILAYFTIKSKTGG